MFLLKALNKKAAYAAFYSFNLCYLLFLSLIPTTLQPSHYSDSLLLVFRV